MRRWTALNVANLSRTGDGAGGVVFPSLEVEEAALRKHLFDTWEAPVGKKKT